MKYAGLADYRHGTEERTAVLVVNLGTPDAPQTGAVRRYLRQFLSDPRVIELPRALWLPLLYGVILPFRSPRSAHAYKQVWTAEGSPLLVNTRALAAGIESELNADGRPLDVAIAMRYGSPSIPAVLARLRDTGMRRLLVLPLYPQFSASTTASVFDEVADTLKSWRWQPELRFIPDYYREPALLDALADSVRRHWQAHGRGDRLLFSFHGIPKRYFLAGDPYHCHCRYVAREVAERLGLDDGSHQVSFQSRVGREEWLRPYTDETVKQLGAAGVGKLDVICPGFAVDCLETLEEIAMQNAEFFTRAGGGALRYIPALNADTGHVQALAGLLRRHGQGWPEFEAATWSPGAAATRSEQQLERCERFLRG